MPYAQRVSGLSNSNNKYLRSPVASAHKKDPASLNNFGPQINMIKRQSGGVVADHNLTLSVEKSGASQNAGAH